MRTLRLYITLALSIAAGTQFFSARATAQNIKNPVAIQSNASGTEFFLAIPPSEILPYPVEGLEIYVSSQFNTDVELYDYAADKTTRFTLAANAVKTLSDKRELNWSMEVRDAETPVRKAIRLRSDKPISVNVINSKALTTDGFMAIPTMKWGTEYLAASYYDMKETKSWAGGFIIVASEPTEVAIELRGAGAAAAKTSEGKQLGTTVKVTLAKGEVYMVHGDGTTRGQFDLTGSRITANNPIGVIGFHMRTTMPNLLINGNGRNHLCEMLPPVSAWGKKYSTIELNRKRLLAGRGDIFRVVAKEANTRWTCKYYDKTSGKLLGERGGVIPTAGGFADEVQTTTSTASVEGFSTWEANKPILLMMYSASSSWDGDQILDPFMVCLSPQEQFVSSAQFQTATQQQFSAHTLNLVVYADTADPNLIENLKSLKIDGTPVWSHPDAEKPSLLFTRMPNGLYWASLRLGATATARTIQSNGRVKFGGYVYGYGPVDAYGWPISSALRDLTSIDTMPPVIKREGSCGDYTLEATELRNLPNPPRSPRRDTDQVETGIAAIDTVDGRNSFNYRLVLVTDQKFPSGPAAYKRFTYTWEVVDPKKDARVVYFVADHAGNVTIDSCIYNAESWSISPATVLFGTIRPEMTASLRVAITNTGRAVASLKNAALSVGDFFAIDSGAIRSGTEIRLAPQETWTLVIRYYGKRETTNLRTDRDDDALLITTSCGQISAVLNGVTAIPRIMVGDFDAGTRGLNEKYCGPISIENPGSDTLFVTGLKGFEGSAFSLSDTLNPTIPFTVAPGQTIQLRNICFVGSKEGAEVRDVVIVSNGAGPDSVSTWKGATNSTSVELTPESWSTCSGLELKIAGRLVVLTGALEDGSGPLTIHDLRGQVVASQDLIENGRTSLTLGPLTPGAYVVAFGSSEKRCSKSIVIAP
ncbi:MAG: hypothetical protein RL594_1329 [Bacteroidota bacterium]